MAVSDFLLLFVAISDGVKGDFMTYRVLLIFCGRSVSVWLGWINGPIPASSGQGWQVPPSRRWRTQDHLWGGRDLATSLSWQSQVSHSYSCLNVFTVHSPQDKRYHPCCSGDRLLSQSRELLVPHLHQQAFQDEGLSQESFGGRDHLQSKTGAFDLALKSSMLSYRCWRKDK